jgi:vacuolar-type H+-ATPase subunit E/Vma4
MGVEEIIAVIDREAREEATRIVEEAEQQATELVANAHSGVQAQVEAAIERNGPEIRGASQRRINAVRLRILEGRARDDAARLVAVFDAAEEQVTAIADGADPERWSSALRALCVEALRSVGGRASVKVRARDVATISSVAAEWQAEVVALADDEEPGLVATSGNRRIEVDARLSVRLQRARALLAETVAQLLDLEPAEREQGRAS